MTDRARPVPQARAARLAAFGTMAGGVAAGAVGEGMRRLARGERPALGDLLLTPGNARRVTDQLSRLRGAAMKLGQMLSLDAGDLLPAELTEILARLREAGHTMPPAQLDRVLATAWGPDWRRHFARFDARPLAAASIGQVHRAVRKSGQTVAIKVQYPGVAASIDADIDNVATLLRLSGLLPAGLDIAPLLAEAKRQLHEEADYLREAGQMRRFADLLADDPPFAVPRPHDDLLHPTALFELTLRELFDFGLMQTDPNFANYRWQADTGRLVLLDFGAAHPVPPEIAAQYRRLLRAGLDGDTPALREGLLEAGLIGRPLLDRHGATVDALITLGLDHVMASRDGLYDFADRTLTEALRTRAAPILTDRASWHLPPAETLFLQRKLGGIALLATRLEARLPLVALAARYA